jgi:hypothetical protein
MTRFDRLSLLLVTGLAAFLRIPGIDARGRFDSDQGKDMLTLVAFTRDGVVPLLGPKTSVGEFHHGAFYYFLLAPASALSNGDPVAVTAFLALLGIAAVALTWWLARSIAGPLAGALAGILIAVSPAAIEQSTFIWNPNPIPFFAVLSLAAAWRARSATTTHGVAGWWALSIGAAGAVFELHILGVEFLLAMLVLCLLAARRDRRVWAGFAGGVAIVGVLLVPLVLFELGSGFLETRRMIVYLVADSGGSTGGPVSALAFTLLRVVGWPLVGVVTNVPEVAAVLLAVVVGLTAVGIMRARAAGRRDELAALVRFVGILVFSTVALAFAAPSLQRVVAGLPNDHYHAFLDPIVVMLLAIPAARLLEAALDRFRAARGAGARAGAGALLPAVASLAIAAGLAALVALEANRKPPHVDPDGGWVAARAAGERIVTKAGGIPGVLVSLPEFKSADGIRFPIQEAFRRLGGSSGAAVTTVVIVCDRLFETAIGAACGGPAEDRFMFGDGTGLTDPDTGVSPDPDGSLLDRFAASNRTWISIYRPVVTP